MSETPSSVTFNANQTDPKHINTLYQAYALWSPILELPDLMKSVSMYLSKLFNDQSIIMLQMVQENATLEFASNLPLISNTQQQTMLEMVYIQMYGAFEITKWIDKGAHIISFNELQRSRLNMLCEFMKPVSHILLPFHKDNHLLGVIIIEHSEDIVEQNIELLNQLAEIIAVFFEKIIIYEQLQIEHENLSNEMNILQQIDEELNDIIDLNYILGMIMDWALRFTNADAAGLALYDSYQDQLTMMANYGFDTNVIAPNQIIPELEGGITLRVARSAKVEVIPDVMLDKDYVVQFARTRTQMSFPILREEIVIAVLTLESQKLNGFTEEHITFVSKLAHRAAVAVDNARLFEETRIEREKLSHILRVIEDGVIVIDPDHRVVLINQAARRALNLDDRLSFVGSTIVSVLGDDNGLLELYQHVDEHSKNLNDDQATNHEVELFNNHTYRCFIDHHPGIGRIIVMQDITTFKESEQLKNELLATVSHDLKQPLSTMRGFMDLLMMVNDFDERSLGYMDQLDYSFRIMRNLIDDLLDMAKIEAGLSLDKQELDLLGILASVRRSLKQFAVESQIDLEFQQHEAHLIILGDELRLIQIFTNLIANAIKYTQSGGWVSVTLEVTDKLIKVLIQDTGIGISEEDLAHIFDRFYRVRNEHTREIEGTGLGLAIVKSLVEHHDGQITVKSRLGVGSLFEVHLPLIAKIV